MKLKSLSIICSILILSNYSYSQTPVSGTLSVNTTWSLVNSPYELTGDVTVSTGITLTIEPGTEIHFSSGDDLFVNGTLIAEGTATDSIRFIGEISDDGGIDLLQGSGASTFSYISAFEFGDNISTRGYAIHVRTASNVQITHSRFDESRGVVKVYDGATPTLDQLTITNAFTAIYVENGHPIISNSIIDGTDRTGIYLLDTATVQNNVISNNGDNLNWAGIHIDAAIVPIIENNTFSGSQIDILTHPEIANDEFFDTNELTEIYLDDKEIATNTTWHKPQTPESWTWNLSGVSSELIVNSGVTLTIEPGTQISFSHSSQDLIIEGTLIAEGTEVDSITFSSVVGGDIWLNETGANSSIQYVTFNKIASGNNSALTISSSNTHISNCLFDECERGITIAADVDPIIQNNTFKNSSDYGIVIEDGSPLITHNLIDGGSLPATQGILISEGKPSIKNNTLQNIGTLNGRVAIHIDAPVAPDIESNTFSDNSWDILTHPEIVNDTLFDNNGLSIIHIDSKNISQNTTWHSPQAPESWVYIKEGGNTIEAGVTLTIEPGVEVQSTNYTHDILVNGTLIAEGTTSDSIKFVGSEIHLNASSINSTFDYVAFSQMGAFNQAGLQIYTSSGQVNHALFDNCEVGISVHDGASPIINYSLFENSNDYGIRVYDDASPVVENSSFSENPFAINNEGTGTVNAINNWWGDDSGPLNSSTNPNGQGEEVSNNVLFTPWLTSNPTNAAITVLTQPLDHSICEMEQVNFSVSATGANNLQYQWQEDQGSGFNDMSDNGQFSGTSTFSLIISEVSTSQSNFNYRCLISGDNATNVFSSEAELNVIAALTIITHPENQEVIEGQGIVFSVNASGSNPSYQWQKNEEDISGANTSSLSLSTASVSDEGEYRCVVSNECNTIISNKAILTLAEEVLGIEKALFNLDTYPNPSSGQFHLHIKNKYAGSMKVWVTDLTGRQVYMRELIKEREEFDTQISIDGLKSGVYFLKVYVADDLSAISQIIIK
ncbi:right-handed parallel beta-helix repeat-containing protein [Ekhidna sp.]